MSHTVSFCYLCHFLQVMLDAEDSWLSQRLQIFVQQGEAGPIALGAVLVGCVASVFGSSSSFRWPRHLPTQFGNAGRNSIGHPRRGAIVSSAGVARAARAARSEFHVAIMGSRGGECQVFRSLRYAKMCQTA